MRGGVMAPAAFGWSWGALQPWPHGCHMGKASWCVLPMSGTWVSATALARDAFCLRLRHRRHGENHVRAEGWYLHGEMWPE